MDTIAAYSTFAMTLGLMVTRPRIGLNFRLDPAAAAFLGVIVMMLFGVVHWTNLGAAALVLWRPLVGIVSIMATTAVAQRLGVLEKLASGVFAARRPEALFTRVFALSALTAATLNNDSAILLLTPLVVVLVRRRYRRHPELVAPFAFAVFMSAGVAPLVISNPMNMVVASYAKIGFNAYALRMVPIAACGLATSFVMLRLVFRDVLAKAADDAEPEALASPWTSAQKQVLLLLCAVMGAYPVVSSLGGAIWPVAAVGAVLALILAQRHSHPALSVARDISWNIVAFLPFVFVLAIGLRNVGLVGHLEAAYARGGMLAVGVCSALGSAILNNHPMSMINMLTLVDGPGGARQEDVLAALIGGDLGPRLFPTGSLAGLLWFESLRRLRVEVSVGRFVIVGALLTIPSLALSLLLLKLLS
ncbi:MAG: ArsB/NhaD family transporter [Polyangiaceae bacterium]